MVLPPGYPASGHPSNPAACHPPGAAPPVLYFPGTPFSWPELQAMAADGVLTQLSQRGYLPPGAASTPQLRARAAACSIPPPIRQRVVAGRMTAAWIYGCTGEPDRIALLVDASRRISSLRATRGCSFHEVKLGPFDVVSLGGLMVSSPLRTAVDIALHVQPERALPALGAFLAAPELDVPLRLLVRAVEATPRVPYRKSALAKLAALLAEQGRGAGPDR
jgi:AbiEi antitoxin C-terminal domain